MNHATSAGRGLSDAAAYLVHFVHGGLVITAFVLVALLGASYLQDDPVSYADLGSAENPAAVAALPPIPVVPAPAVVAEGVKALPAKEPMRAQALKPAVPGGLSAEMRGVRDFLAPRYKVSARALEPLLVAAEKSGTKLGIDPLLIVAVIAIESSFNPFAESSMGAQGLMQVIPRFHLDKIGRHAGEDALFDPMLNIRVGTQVLVEGMQRFGSLQGALQYYGGAVRDPNASYANKVLAMKRRLLAVAGRAKSPEEDA